MSANAKAERELMAMVLRGEVPRGAIQHADNTRKGYAASWNDFQVWCKLQRLESLPATPQTVLLYCHAQLATGHKVATAIHRLSAINSYHQAAGYPKPADSMAWQFLLAIRRMRGEQPAQKAALTIEQLRAMCIALPENLRGRRDRALLAVAFGSALRRSTIVGLDLADVEFRPEGLVLRVKREKQDRRGDGRTLGVVAGKHLDFCPVRLLEAWVKARGQAQGPLFTPTYYEHALIRRLQPATVARIVKDAAIAIGLDPAQFAGHSTRAGFVTSCINAGLPDLMVMAHTGHRDVGTLRIYHRRASDPFVGNPSGLIDL